MAHHTLKPLARIALAAALLSLTLMPALAQDTTADPNLGRGISLGLLLIGAGALLMVGFVAAARESDDQPDH